MQSSNFYIYEHIRPDTGMIFYVGKGCGRRLTCGKYGGGTRNNHWKAVVAKAGGFEARKLVENVDEEFSFLIEEERIDQLNRLDIKLTNKTLGGCGGRAGYSHTDETKKKIAESRAKTYKKENHHRFGKFGKDNPQYGKKQSAEARLAMSINSSMKRPEVVAKISGERSILAKSVEYEGKIYKTMNNLAEYLGISGQTLRSRIFRGKSEKYGYKVLGKTQDLTAIRAASA